MTRVVHLAAPLEPDVLVVASASRRSYLGLSRDGSYVHHVRPARLEEPVVGDGLRRTGQLTCDCNGGRFRGTCYWVERCEQLEAGPERPAPEPIAAPAWLRGLDNPAGAGEMVEASRG